MSSPGTNRKRQSGGGDGDRLFAPQCKKKARTNSILKINVIPTHSEPSTPVVAEAMVALSPCSILPIPEWYSEVPTIFNGNRGDVISVEQLRSFHERAKTAVTKSEDPTYLVNLVRSQIHTLSCAYGVTKAILKKTKVLTDRTLHEMSDPEVFPISVPYSLALQSDAGQLYEKWFKGDVDGSLLRGIKPSIGKTKNKLKMITSTYRHYDIEKDYITTSYKFTGEGHLKNGDWWPLQLAAVRDGAHGDPRGGISGRKGHGAFSVVMNMATEKESVDPTTVVEVYNKYPNFDLPAKNQIWYCGTQGKATKGEQKGLVSDRTKLLKESFEKNLPIRVIRGSGITSKLAPPQGLRYDGLYHIIEEACICEEYATWLFLLERLPGQDPIRYEGPDMRPHEVELKDWNAWLKKASAHKFE